MSIELLFWLAGWMFTSGFIFPDFKRFPNPAAVIATIGLIALWPIVLGREVRRTLTR